MKYLKQLSVILIISFAAEVLYYVLPLPIPASIYGLLLLFVLLQSGLLKLEQVEDTAEFILAIMPLFFISPSVSLMEAFVGMKGKSIVSLVIMCVVSTIVVTVSTGLVAQMVMKRKKDR